MGGLEALKSNRTWLLTKSPASGVRSEAFLRCIPSWTAVTEVDRAPISTTSAVGFPVAKL